MTEHPIFETINRQLKFQNRVPYYLIAIGISWGISIGILIKIWSGN